MIGSVRARLPVAAKIALHNAGAAVLRASLFEQRYVQR